jgi:hypothetical protein
MAGRRTSHRLYASISNSSGGTNNAKRQYFQSFLLTLFGCGMGLEIQRMPAQQQVLIGSSKFEHSHKIISENE